MKRERIVQKIIARMRGGLGHQLFILACAYYTKEFCAFDAEIVLDTREYKNYKVRKFEILELIEDYNLRVFDENNEKSLKYDFSRNIYHIFQKFIESNKPIGKYFLKNGLIYSKRSTEGISNSLFKTDVYLYGYFQDARMTVKVKESMKNSMKSVKCDFKLDPNVSYIGVSIRWGQDYVNQGWPICSKQYYENGIQEIVNEKYQNRKICVLIFSDEIEKAKQIKIECPVCYIQGLSSSQQLTLMRKCQDFVISNSSFSWWGAFLGSNIDSIVIAPDIWYDSKEPTKEALLCFENMRIRQMN